MKFLKYAWVIFLNLFIILISFSILDSYYEDSSIVTIALLLIILTNINVSLALQVRTSATVAAETQKNFAEIMRKLKDEELAEDLEADSKLITDSLKASNYKVIINSIGSTIIWLIAILAILGTL